MIPVSEDQTEARLMIMIMYSQQQQQQQQQHVPTRIYCEGYLSRGRAEAD